MTFICGNWKMHKNKEEALKYINDFKLYVRDIKNEIVLAVPYTILETVNIAVKDTNIKVAAQNMHHEEEGAYTGEISVKMIKDFAEYVILGHSERRKYFNETNVGINKKIKLALKNNLKVIYCLGETQDQRNQNNTKSVIETQLREGIKDITIEQIPNVIIAYEPVWAIGTGNTATPEQANEVHSFIRDLLKQLYDENTSSNVKIIYGGSVNSKNAQSILSQENIDGCLPGGASLVASELAKITKVQ